MWATGYFCWTVGTITNEIIKNYIDEQNNDVDELFKGKYALAYKWLLVTN